MNKAILVIDMPINCYECDLNNYHFCDVTRDCIEEYTDTEYRPDFCPLRELPEKYDVDHIIWDRDYDNEFECGYNQCIDEILGEQP